MQRLALICTTAYWVTCCHGFTTPQAPPSLLKQGIHRNSQPPTRLSLLEDPAVIEEVTNARFAFWMCFYGAAGVGSIGRELIPIVFGRYERNKKLAVAGQTSGGGEDLGIWGYPEKIYRSDVEDILNNSMDAEVIAKKYAVPVENQYQYTHIVPTQFLTYDAFVAANPKANPVAVRAVFDSFSNSIGGGNSVAPASAQMRIDAYKEDLSAMANKLNSGKSLGIVAFVTVLILLGIADGLAIFHIWKGWFPEWQGFNNMPASLFSSETGIATLPQYFVNDLPKA